uniref:NADH-ubiquinone oxidoreductase chain 3 n=1 Tax=Hoploplana elisabelloi TaxID=1714492 RepID=A0A0P0C6Q1_9PLAT|nr:NADH dehydrogenase subunit 3 [Hoploplana elisabelloi]ALI86941.1 NADH dehydrogenase subunit 3 [Hoploplana elisabelloi]
MSITSVLFLMLVIFLSGAWIFWTSRKNYLNSREKSSPFECGFDPKDKARIPFSLRFFLIVILFLIFDVELSLLLQLPYQLDFEHFKGRLGLLGFLWILLLGTLEEWRRGILNWKD